MASENPTQLQHGNSNDLGQHSNLLGFAPTHASVGLAERLSRYQANQRDLEALQREDDSFKHLWTSPSIVKLRQRTAVHHTVAVVPGDGAQTVCSLTQVKDMQTFWRALTTEPALREVQPIRKLAEWTLGVDIFYGLSLHGQSQAFGEQPSTHFP